MLRLEQLLGTGGELDDGIITCTGTFDAFSPDTKMSAAATGPHTYPSRNTKHSSRGLPLESLACGNEMLSMEDTMRKPDDPVSTET